MAQQAIERAIRSGHGCVVHGPSGAGKTHAVRAALASGGWGARWVQAPDLFSGREGRGEARLRRAFAATDPAVAVVVLEQLELVAPRRGAGSVERRMQAELMRCLDGRQLVCVAVTEHLGDVHEAALAAHRLGTHVLVGIPTPAERAALVRREWVRPGDDGDALAAAAASLHGAVAADLVALCRGAVLAAGAAGRQHVTAADVAAAAATAEPSLLRSEQSKQILATARPVAEAIAGYAACVRQLRACIVGGDALERLGLAPPAGVLVHGAPGTGKTTMVLSVCKDASANFIVVHSATLLSKLVGESERNIAALFAKARAARPCILFLDQVEAIARKRGFDSSEGHAADRVLSALLTEMSGIESRSGVLVVAATACADLLDPAFVRAGRMDVHLELPLPDADDRRAILALYAARAGLGPDAIDVDALATSTAGKTPADLEGLVSERVRQHIGR